MRNNHIILAVTTLLLSVSNVSLSATPTTFYTAGSYTDQFAASDDPMNSSTFPLLASSLDNGDTWFVSDQVNGFPRFMHGTAFTAATWHQDAFIFVGNYKTLAGNTLFTMKNNVVQDINPLPQDFYKGRLSDIACMDNNCFSIGHYQIKNGKTLPLLLNSQNNGTTWNLANIPLPADALSAKLKSLACNGDQCIAIGNYVNQDKLIRPYILTTNNKRNEWKLSQPVTNFPPTLQHATLSKLTCTSQYCVAYGHYTIFNKPSQTLPFVLVQQDKNTSWHFMPLHTDLANNTRNGWLSCVANQCLVSGSSGFKTFMFSTQDSGKTWTEIKNANLNANAYVLSCNKQYCVAAGRSDDIHFGDLSILQSVDFGRTWKQATHVPKLAFPAIGSIQCTDEACVIVGAAITNDYMRPIIVVSHDQGLNWQSIGNGQNEAPFSLGNFDVLSHSN